MQGHHSLKLPLRELGGGNQRVDRPMRFRLFTMLEQHIHRNDLRDSGAVLTYSE